MESAALCITDIDFDIYQYRCFGYSLEDTAAKFDLPVEAVQEAVERYCTSRGIVTTRNVGQRKAIALSRLDLATKALMPKLVAGEQSAIHTYLKIQEREAKLTGMEAPQKQDTHITIDIPWLTRDRLSYKDAEGQVVENVTDITPILEVRKAADSVQVEQRAERLDLNPWKPAPPEAGLAAILRDADKKP